MNLSETYLRAAEAIRNASSMVITAGAGIGVDSGLPDFRGDKGFWNAYPMYERLGVNFVGAANPVHFHRDPQFGWGFYGHRLNLYRNTIPHAGFKMMQDWAKRFNLPQFVYTSNVDGQFQKAGFSDEQVCEIHGSIHHLQCLEPCSEDIWKNEEIVEVNLETMRAGQTPKCPRCQGIARPNILMFGDFGWIHARTHAQEQKFAQFLEAHGKGYGHHHAHQPMVVIEMGAGTAIPSIRNASEGLYNRYHAPVIRINPRQFHIDEPNIPVPTGALEDWKA